MSSYKAQLEQYSKEAYDRWLALPRRAKVVLCIFGLVQTAIGVTVLWIGPERIFEHLAVYARDLREIKFGWLIIVAGIMLSSIPPIVSLYGMIVTICGFTYDSVLVAWLVASLGCLIGSAFSFLLCRLFLSRFRRLLDENKHVGAISRVIKDKGMPLIALVRLAPISFAYSNLLFASISSVDLPRFLLATLAITPKLLLHVFIGNRMFKLADPQERQKLDKQGKIINIVSIVIGVLVGTGTGVYVWRLVQKYINAVELTSNDEHLEEGLLRRSSSSSEHSSGRHTPVATGEEMSLEEIDSELQRQGVREEGDQWGDNFSDFEDEQRRNSVDVRSQGDRQQSS